MALASPQTMANTFIAENKVVNERRIWSRGCREMGKYNEIKRSVLFIGLHLRFDLVPNKKRS